MGDREGSGRGIHSRDAVEVILSPPHAPLQDDEEVSEFALDGLKQVMAVKSRVVLPYLVPKVHLHLQHTPHSHTAHTPFQGLLCTYIVGSGKASAGSSVLPWLSGCAGAGP